MSSATEAQIVTMHSQAHQDKHPPGCGFTRQDDKVAPSDRRIPSAKKKTTRGAQGERAMRKKKCRPERTRKDREEKWLWNMI